MTDVNADDHFDDAADETMKSCINLDQPKSFFLYAGAGSGKTRSLVNVIEHACLTQGRRLALSRQRIAVITYTNAACDEIKQRLKFDPRVEVATIHSFAWSLIAGYDKNICIWLRCNLLKEIADLEEQQSRGRANTKASIDRAHLIENKRRRHAMLGEIRQFIYSPTGDNRTRDSLNHSEVISMTADLLTTTSALQRLLVSRYPVLLIDESQDTNSRLMDALLSVQVQQEAKFCLGLLGDTMQRIYADGKIGIAEAIPASWARPEKRMNHRCPARVIMLINKIRTAEDGQEQRGRSDKPEGCVRLFVLQQEIPDKFQAEEKISERMAELSKDLDWLDGKASVKTLILEHHMAAKRLGFEAFFEALYPVKRLRTGLLDGTLPSFAFFARDILPLIRAMKDGDKFRTAAFVRKRSPLLHPSRLKDAGKDQVLLLRTAKEACDSLQELFSSELQPSLLDVLRNVATSGLFAIPESLSPFVVPTSLEVEDGLEDDEDAKSEIVAWRRALNTTFDQIEKFDSYIRGVSPFDTHQGVKGLEFPRVMVIINDDEARGFLFSYEKLFGAKGKSKTDLENEASGLDTTVKRTQRLFYVTCSRAEQSLAIVYYSNRPDLVRDTVVSLGWFEDSEVEMVT